MEKTLIVLFIIFRLSDAQKPIPTYIQTCRRSDPNLNECFAKNANLAMKYIAKGDPEYDIKSLSPLKWRDTIGFKAPDLEFQILGITVFGLENVTIVEPNIDLNKNIIQFVYTSPLIIWKGDYNATVEENGKGKQKNGHFEFHFKDSKNLVTFEYELQDRNGLQYAKITKSTPLFVVDVDIKPNDSDTNGLSSKNWKNLKNNIVTPEMQDYCAKTVVLYIEKVFDVVPFNNIFPE